MNAKKTLKVILVCGALLSANVYADGSKQPPPAAKVESQTWYEVIIKQFSFNLY